MKKPNYSVLVLMHPINRKGCFELLFSYDGMRFSTVDGNSPEYLKQCGLNTACKFEVTPAQFYSLMGKALDYKIRTLDIHIRYKDNAKMLKFFKMLAERCVNAQCKYSEDLELPESVVTLANSCIVSPV